MEALIFDCDGVLADTERDGHRVAFNQAFATRERDLGWTVERYGELLSTGGGKERLRRHFDETGWPEGTSDQNEFILDLHANKTKLFMELIEAGDIPSRPGVARLAVEALDAGLPLAVCSTAAEAAVKAVVISVFGPETAARFSIFAGDMAAAKKPDPAVYNLAKETLGLNPALTVVIEDSAIGLEAAVAAGMACIVTPSFYTAGEDFTGAALIVDDLANISLSDCAVVLDGS